MSDSINSINPPLTALLTVRDLSMRFGGITAIDKVSFEALSGKITAVIGPNGAGKTTFFNCLTGFYRPTGGSLYLKRDDHNIALHDKSAHHIARLGVARTFQNIRLFSNMTVLENLLVAEHQRLMKSSYFSFAALLRLKSYMRVEKRALDRARYWLDRLMLITAADRLAGELPYGMQRRLEIARAMCTDPLLLCLDEPAAGLNPNESLRLRDVIKFIRDEHKISILLIEHNMNVVMEISDHVIVLDYGKLIAEGNADAIRNNPSVIRAYLGDPLEEKHHA